MIVQMFLGSHVGANLVFAPACPLYPTGSPTKKISKFFLTSGAYVD